MSGAVSDIPRGIRLGVDVGDARVGLARSDMDGMIATPVETVPREAAEARILAYAHEAGAHVIMVGLPRRLDGSEGPAAQKARDFCAELLDAALAAGHDVEVRLIDERLTTVDAHRALHASGRKGRKHRSVVDQVAAVMILQSALETERSTGRRSGELVEPPAQEEATDGPVPGPALSTPPVRKDP